MTQNEDIYIENITSTQSRNCTKQLYVKQDLCTFTVLFHRRET